MLKSLGLRKLLSNKRTKQISALSMLAQAGRELSRGDVKLAVLYVVGAAVSYKNTAVGFAMQVLLRTFRRGGGQNARS